jgi:hypothetical protein
MSSKRQTTFAKMARERAVKERRALKQEKKQAAAAARIAEAAGETSPTPDAPEGEDASAEPPEQSTEATALD